MESNFSVILIGMHNYVEGATRLQKYAFLSAMQIKNINSEGFYNDWKASHFGPFSAMLAQDVDKAIKDGIIEKHSLTNPYGFKVDRFAVSEGGKGVFTNLKTEHHNLYDKILKITKRYQGLSLSRLLQDVYYQYPNYASASTIKARIARKIYESDSYLSTEYDEPDL